jgi:hypothetical protein
VNHPQAIALVTSKSVNHHLVNLVHVTHKLQLIVMSFAHSARVQVDVIAQQPRVQTHVMFQVVSAIVTTEFWRVLPQVQSKRATALSVADQGQVTSHDHHHHHHAGHLLLNPQV